MADEKKSWIKQYGKDLLIVVSAIFLVFYVAVFSSVWADRNYSNNFWPNFFEYSGYVVGAILIILWVILWTSQRRNK